MQTLDDLLVFKSMNEHQPLPRDRRRRISGPLGALPHQRRRERPAQLRLGRHASGYTPFRYDLTDVLNYGGKNVIAVRVDATSWEGWWYEGAGIYRHAWLVKTDPLPKDWNVMKDPDKFYDNVDNLNPPPKDLMQTFKAKQTDFYLALAHLPEIRPTFNPAGRHFRANLQPAVASPKAKVPTTPPKRP